MVTRLPVTRLLLALLPLSLACEAGSLLTASDPRLHVTVLPTGNVPPPDPARSYWYAFSSWNADSVLGALLDDGSPVARAFEPLDDLCENPIGPRLTVELTAPDSSILAHDFVQGAGLLFCATRLRVYTVIPPP